MPNRLAASSSPYLRQHAHNPVDWSPWDDEALARARTEDKPILLSIGYAACHWCHVMERESFEDPDVAAQMNAHFVNVKVDREERPDLDNVYQTAIALTGRGGGWPLTAFLTPDGRPFFLGTYFPPEARHGLPSFSQVLHAMLRAWTEKREDVLENGDRLRDAIARAQAPRRGRAFPGPELVAEAAAFLLSKIDPVHGGFGTAPKFPSPSNLAVLVRHWLRTGDSTTGDAVLLTLRKMADGGVYDQLGGGFHRYSTDAEWLVPHFEKMLYDNAQLVPLYLDAWRMTGDPELLRVATETLDYVSRDLGAPDGTFYGTTDADSEGVEGRYFVWTPAEVRAGVGDDEVADTFCRFYDVTPRGNWEGHSILRRRGLRAEDLRLPPDELERRLTLARTKLLAVRGTRVPPLRDEKVLASWNALQVRALVEGWSATGEARWLDAAVRAAEGLVAVLVQDGALAHSVCAGDVRGPGLLDDHAALGDALLRLHEATGTRRWLDLALGLAVRIDGAFADGDGDWFQTPDDGEALVVRPRDVHDGAVPSGTALTAAFFARLAVHTQERRWADRVEAVLVAEGELLDRNPYGAGHLLGVLDAWHHGHAEVVLGGEGPGREALERAARRAPALDVLVLRLEDLPPEHPAAGGRSAETPTAWVCRGTTCSLPLRTPEALRAALVG